MTEPVTANCHICGAAPVSPESHHGSPLCAGCLPAREHAVSMRGPGGTDGMSLALCQCGWESQMPWGGHHEQQRTAIVGHWQDAIAVAHVVGAGA